jgi:long-chain fatty acid transport protein
VSLVLAAPRVGHAGGYELPDVGTEALGRGGAFTAKADNGTALTYNVAGFAQQRGTHALVDVHLVFDDYAFKRAGTYPDSATDPRTPWGGRPFPTVANESGPSFAPYAAASTDFGSFDRLTFAAGVFGPSASTGRLFPINAEGGPNPARYDVVKSSNLVVYPTLAAAYRMSDELDIGVAIHGVYGSFDVLQSSVNDFGPSSCPNAEYRGCDSDERFTGSGFTVAGAAGALWHPSRAIGVGLALRSPWSMNAKGTIASSAPPVQPEPIPTTSASVATGFPLVLRLGARAAALDGAFERGDVEVDATYEGWSAAEGTGPVTTIPNIDIGGKRTSIRATTLHGFGDTFSVRAGGAYNTRGSIGIVSLRAGAFYDSAATSTGYTRVDTNTLAKIGLTLGAGLRAGAFSFDVAYAEVFSPSRTVEDGAIRPSNGLKNGDPVDANGALLGVVNNGEYHAHTRVLSFGIAVHFDRSVSVNERAVPEK